MLRNAVRMWHTGLQQCLMVMRSLEQSCIRLHVRGNSCLAPARRMHRCQRAAVHLGSPCMHARVVAAGLGGATCLVTCLTLAWDGVHQLLDNMPSLQHICFVSAHNASAVTGVERQVPQFGALYPAIASSCHPLAAHAPRASGPGSAS